MLKLVVFVPLDFADVVRAAMAEAGAGVMGDYTHCSFSSRGVGRFLPGVGAAPFEGKVGELSAVEEERIEVVVDDEKIQAVIAAMRKVHPYEEVAFDVYRLVEV